VFWRSLNDRLQADGTEAAIATELPLTSEDNPTPFVATAADGRAITVKLRSVSPNYFSVMRMHIRDGRGLAATDIRSAPMAVVVNEHMARLLDRSQPAVGQVLTFDFGGGPVRADVVGVVSDIRHAGLNRSPFAESYFSFEQTPLTTYSLVVASRRPIADVARRLRGVLDSIDPAQPFAPLIAYTEHIDRSLSGARLQMQVVGMFSLAAAAIAAFGVYGLLMFIVTNCRREWALRLAMGAAPGDILRMVLRQSMTYAVAGVALGLAVFGIAARWLKAVVYGVQLWDPTVILAYAVLMAMVCIAAASIPAWRAAAISPSECLRA
jgi:hypothetical protein